MDIYEFLKKIKFNSKEEAQAIIDYTELLESLSTSDFEIDEEKKEEIAKVIFEIIQDEQDHELKLMSLYSELSGIEPKGD